MIVIDKNTFQAESWTDLQTQLFEIYEPNIDRYRSKFAYRGVADKDFDMFTSIQRIGRKPSDVEARIIRNFQKYSPLNTLIDNYNNIWNWIALGQHHGLPTRLLDWTFSPNVALHFMTENIETYDKDGAVWMVDFFEARNMLPQALLFEISKKNILTFTSHELKAIIGDTIEDIDSFATTHGDALVFFEPPSMDNRIVNQFALFSFMLNPNTHKADWFRKYPNLYKKIIIPKELKWEIRDKLDQANISERIIYPGLEGISKWLKRWYTEKNTNKYWKI